jgi:hypothetical protein
MSLLHKPFQARVSTRTYRTVRVHATVFAGFDVVFARLDSVVLLVSGRESDASETALACNTAPSAHTHRGKPCLLALLLTVFETPQIVGGRPRTMFSRASLVRSAFDAFIQSRPSCWSISFNPSHRPVAAAFATGRHHLQGTMPCYPLSLLSSLQRSWRGVALI